MSDHQNAPNSRIAGPPFDLIWAGLAGTWLVVESVLFGVRGMDPVVSAVWAAGLVVAGLLVVTRRGEPELVSALRWGSSVTVAGGAAALAIGGNFTLFLAMHALLVVVLCAAVLRPVARRTDWVASGRVRVRLTWTVAGTCAGLIAFSLMQDLRGLPLIHPDVASLVTLGTMFETAVTVAIAVLWRGRRETVTTR
ncbi:hypothetical protein Acor_12870 [Acrocarpospora corrugata]|uniref:Uncharacterized protein n=1 Tax=Acrocarpospora corrugata TaxID=35763 RepID=A0A5M3VRU6_9ACTN|nr:hypothetical protein [Acrocarpospora corrugata]GER99223.1 hypothetical protein Acor_12870 [Acrocarpospora corrugata]